MDSKYIEYTGKSIKIMTCSNCNMKCKQCYIAYKGNFKSKQLFDVVKLLKKKYEILLNGTEPLLNSYLDSYKISNEKTILTNGLLFKNNLNLVDEIKAAGITRICMSYQYDIQKDIQSVDLNYLDEIFPKIRQKGIDVEMMCTITSKNYQQLDEICKKAINSTTLKYGGIGVLCIIGFSIVYNSSIISIFNLGDSGNANQEGVVELIKSNAFLGFLSVVILAPIVEELTYRYCIFGATCKKKKWIGYLISSIVFMAMHSLSSFLSYGFSKQLLTEMLYLPPYLFSGLALCYLYDKTDNLGSSFIAHLLNNLISFLAIVYA